MAFIMGNPGCWPTPAPVGGSWRYLYPAEYLSYGLGSTADIITTPDGTKEFKLTDHLGSTRVAVQEGGAMKLVMNDPNKLRHLFAPKHKLESLVSKLGGKENTVRTVLNAANGKLPKSGVLKDVPVKVWGKTILIRGSVVNGVPRLGTMFIK